MRKRTDVQPLTGWESHLDGKALERKLQESALQSLTGFPGHFDSWETLLLEVQRVLLQALTGFPGHFDTLRLCDDTLWLYVMK